MAEVDEAAVRLDALGEDEQDDPEGGHDDERMMRKVGRYWGV